MFAHFLFQKLYLITGTLPLSSFVFKGLTWQEKFVRDKRNPLMFIALHTTKSVYLIPLLWRNVD